MTTVQLTPPAGAEFSLLSGGGGGISHRVLLLDYRTPASRFWVRGGAARCRRLAVGKIKRQLGRDAVPTLPRNGGATGGNEGDDGQAGAEEDAGDGDGAS